MSTCAVVQSTGAVVMSQTDMFLSLWELTSLVGHTDLTQVNHKQTHDHTTYKEGTGFGEREYPKRREGSDGQGSLLCKSDKFKAET